MTMIDGDQKVQGFRIEGVAVVVVRGDVGSATASSMRAAFEALGPNEHVYVDCAAVGFIDSDGLAALREVAQRNVIAGGPLHVHASNAVRRLVEINDLEYLFAFD
jgi:anti-anti-sigma regulatory factor